MNDELEELRNLAREIDGWLSDSEGKLPYKLVRGE